MMPSGAYGPGFLATENFKVIRLYNTSDLYALFVGDLADRIAGAGGFHVPAAQVAQPRTAQVKEIQERLQKLGYPMDKIDGKIGSNTRRQVGTYQKTGRPQDRLLADRGDAFAPAFQRRARSAIAGINRR